MVSVLIYEGSRFEVEQLLSKMNILVYVKKWFFFRLWELKHQQNWLNCEVCSDYNTDRR